MRHDLLTIVEAQKRLRIGRNTMYALCRRPDFPTLCIGRRILIPEAQLESWIANQTKGGEKHDQF